METILGTVMSALAVWGMLDTATADSNSSNPIGMQTVDERCLEVDKLVSRLLVRESPAEYLVWPRDDEGTAQKEPDRMSERPIDERPDAVWSFISGICLRKDPSPQTIDISLKQGLRWGADMRSPLGPPDSVTKGFWGVDIPPFQTPGGRGNRGALGRIITQYGRDQRGNIENVTTTAYPRPLPGRTEVEWHRFSYAEFAVVNQRRRAPSLVGVRLNPERFFQAHLARSRGPIAEYPIASARSSDGESETVRPEVLGIHSVTQSNPFSSRLRLRKGKTDALTTVVYTESEDNWLYVVVHVLDQEAWKLLGPLDVRTSNNTLAATLYAWMDVSGVPRWIHRSRSQSVNPFLRVAVRTLLQEPSDVLLAFKGRYDLSKGFYLRGPAIRLSLAPTGGR